MVSPTGATSGQTALPPSIIKLADTSLTRKGNADVLDWKVDGNAIVVNGKRIPVTKCPPELILNLFKLGRERGVTITFGPQQPAELTVSGTLGDIGAASGPDSEIPAVDELLSKIMAQNHVKPSELAAWIRGLLKKTNITQPETFKQGTVQVAEVRSSAAVQPPAGPGNTNPPGNTQGTGTATVTPPGGEVPPAVSAQQRAIKFLALFEITGITVGNTPLTTLQLRGKIPERLLAIIEKGMNTSGTADGVISDEDIKTFLEALDDYQVVFKCDAATAVKKYKSAIYFEMRDLKAIRSSMDSLGALMPNKERTTFAQMKAAIDPSFHDVLRIEFAKLRGITPDQVKEDTWIWVAGAGKSAYPTADAALAETRRFLASLILGSKLDEATQKEFYGAKISRVFNGDRIDSDIIWEFVTGKRRGAGTGPVSNAAGASEQSPAAPEGGVRKPPSTRRRGLSDTDNTPQGG